MTLSYTTVLHYCPDPGTLLSYTTVLLSYTTVLLSYTTVLLSYTTFLHYCPKLLSGMRPYNGAQRWLSSDTILFPHSNLTSYFPIWLS